MKKDSFVAIKIQFVFFDKKFVWVELYVCHLFNYSFGKLHGIIIVTFDAEGTHFFVLCVFPFLNLFNNVQTWTSLHRKCLQLYFSWSYLLRNIEWMRFIEYFTQKTICFVDKDLQSRISIRGFEEQESGFMAELTCKERCIHCDWNLRGTTPMNAAFFAVGV